MARPQCLKPLLCMENITKRFGPYAALDSVSLELRAGEVHALIGENGAGKSTLMKVLSGAHRPDSGRILLDGQPVRFGGPSPARAAGIAMIYQELTLANHLTVEENVTLGAERSRCGVLRSRSAEVRAVLATLGHSELDTRCVVGQLSPAMRQIVEIARALAVSARVIIMDEPTSSLSGADTRVLFETIRRLRDQGVAVVYISHFLEEVREIAQRYTVLRDGRVVASGETAGVTLERLVRCMVGRELTEMFPKLDHATGEVLLEARGIRSARVKGVTLAVDAGEILGIAGLVGSGRTELLRCIAGLDSGATGELRIARHGTYRLKGLDRRATRQLGIDLLSENRKEEGLMAGQPIGENVTISSLSRFVKRYLPGVLWLRQERGAAEGACRDMGVVHRSLRQKAGELSGGNQQKVVLARMMMNDCRIVLLDEPTRGVDIVSKVEIYRKIQAFAQAGKAVIMVSSYLPELFGVCDAIAVMFRGTMSEKAPRSQWTEERVMHWATSGRDDDCGSLAAGTTASLMPNVNMDEAS